ncbi:MAG: peroxidase-related enzyme [Alphaproteobacteria bacterium]|nr:peroxidase-related enzyme [Alphaproteobacteria bacterium]
MPQPDHLIALDLEMPDKLEPDLQKYFDKCEEKIGFVPNVIRTYAAKPERWRVFVAMYHALMDDKGSSLTKLEREMIAVVVSCVNRCYYCLVAHGAAVRGLSGDPELGEMLVMNYRTAELSKRQRAMLDFAWKITETPWLIEEPDRKALRKAGFSDSDIFDISEVASFYNMSNRMAYGTHMMPNREYHNLDR